jgi:DNA modification methylase
MSDTPAQVPRTLRNSIVGHEDVPPADLLANPGNFRTHPPSQRNAMRDQIDTIGWIQRVIVNTTTGQMIDGHLRTEIALERDEPTVPVIYVTLTEAEEKLALLSFDALGALAEHDEDLLDRVLDEYGPAPTEHLQALLDGLRGDLIFDEEPEPDPSDDDCPDAPADPISEPGDVWLCGDHRVMCADSTIDTDVQTLCDGPIDMVWTDPPYNVAYESADGKSIQNDDMEDAQFRQFLHAMFAAAIGVTKDGGPIYIAHADGEGYNFRGAMIDSGWLCKQCVIWVKNSMVLGRQDYQWQHEPILYGWKPGAAHCWYGERDKKTTVDDESDPRAMDKSELVNEVRRLRNARNTSIVRVDKPSRSSEHPTMKPVALIVHFIRNSSRRNDTVLDLCGGSGSTLIAADKTGRRARLMELDPKYCDVILQRYQKHTGQPAILASTGQHYSELQAQREPA